MIQSDVLRLDMAWGDDQRAELPPHSNNPCSAALPLLKLLKLLKHSCNDVLM